MLDIFITTHEISDLYHANLRKTIAELPTVCRSIIENGGNVVIGQPTGENSYYEVGRFTTVEEIDNWEKQIESFVALLDRSKNSGSQFFTY